MALDKAKVTAWMQKNAADYVDHTTNEVNYTGLAEGAADAFDDFDALDDETHWVWDVALSVGQAYERKLQRGASVAKKAAVSDTTFLERLDDIKRGTANSKLEGLYEAANWCDRLTGSKARNATIAIITLTEYGLPSAGLLADDLRVDVRKKMATVLTDAQHAQFVAVV